MTAASNWSHEIKRCLLLGKKSYCKPTQHIKKQRHHFANKGLHQFSSVQLLSHVQLFATPWTAAHQASLSITNYQSIFKLMSTESGVPSNHLILYHPLLLPPSIFPTTRVFSNESVLCIRWPKYWSFSLSISPSNDIQDCLSLGWTGWISLLSKGHSRFLSTPQFKSTQLLYTPILISVHDYWKNHSFL